MEWTGTWSIPKTVRLIRVHDLGGVTEDGRKVQVVRVDLQQTRIRVDFDCGIATDDRCNVGKAKLVNQSVGPYSFVGRALCRHSNWVVLFSLQTFPLKTHRIWR